MKKTITFGETVAMYQKHLASIKPLAGFAGCRVYTQDPRIPLSEFTRVYLRDYRIVPDPVEEAHRKHKKGKRK